MAAPDEQSGTLNRRIARFFLVVGAGLPVVGVPVAVVSGLEGMLGISVRIVASAVLYLLTAGILHPGVWGQLPLKYMPGRVRTAAFVTFAAGTAMLMG